MVSMVFLLLAAGSETTTHLISGSVYELLRNPGLRDWLEQDWSRAGLAVEEFLRFVSPVQFSKPRYVRRDIELEGVPLKKGDRVMVMLAAANMDPAVHDQPERLDLTAQAEPPHLVRNGNSFLSRPSARTHRGGLCAGGAVHAMAEARSRRRSLANSLAQAAGHACHRGVAGRRGGQSARRFP